MFAAADRRDFVKIVFTSIGSDRTHTHFPSLWARSFANIEGRLKLLWSREIWGEKVEEEDEEKGESRAAEHHQKIHHQHEMEKQKYRNRKFRNEGPQVSVEVWETDEIKRQKKKFKSKELNFQNEIKEIGGKEVTGNRFIELMFFNLKALNS